MEGKYPVEASQVLNGRYEVGELIGRGGMADVHLGRDVRLGRTVAIKQLRPDLARDPSFQSRFRREAQAVAGLNHPAIVAVYDTGEQELPGSAAHDVKAPFIVMEYVRGRTLRDLIRSGELTIEKSIDYALGVLAALQYSHRSGIVHRDIKPANVMVTPDDHVKVMDFGIARALADSAATMTQTQAVLGTAQYLSPEQARGETVDARSDLYSAACLLYEMLASRPPFIGDSPVSVAYQHVRELPEPPSSFNRDVTPALDSVLARALQKDKTDRFQDAASFSAALQGAREGITVAADEARTEAMPAQSAPTAAFTAAPFPVPVGTPGSNGPSTPEAGESPDEQYETDGLDQTGPINASPHTAAIPLALQVGNESEEVDPGRRNRRRAWTTVLVIALVLLLAGGGFYLFNTLRNAQPDMVPVPQVAGMEQTEASNTIYGQGLVPRIEPQFSDEVAEGEVISTDPEGGTAALPDSEVIVYVSQGKEFATIPEDFSGRTEGEVRDKLRQLGLVPGENVSANSAVIPSGNVIATDPKAGEKVRTGSTVDLVISNGLVTVPALLDKTEEEAISLLQDDPAVALPYRVEQVENEVVEPGTVTAQSHEAGSNVPQGTQIVITVAVAPEPAPEPTEPEPTDPPTESNDNNGNNDDDRGRGNNDSGRDDNDHGGRDDSNSRAEDGSDLPFL
ncbi:Stk1 family PASTA domain-containing Ser/Thr kinase [Arthrobacter crystallopoietes]|uniref:Stk1 family PASTA domain-containing Ser/Thr kinase n=1 Tax=Crystallibacter crystallopoietes TaxID=37928 RepID=UPI001ABEBE62|nr:Stk1 family PASTA domain-containing Ser/Thr kinase [Arthrobacter crystallopoietes]QTG81832.1 Stk1 family PASTA domain-containing Ser/Thr kinase [Arthrobacter crystallopoietes]